MKYLRKEKGYFVFEKSIMLKCDTEKLYEFHLDTNNLPLISPPFPKARLEYMSDNPLKIGSRVVIEVSFIFISLKWVIRIKEAEAPNLIGDLQEKGFFKYWYHSHIFKECEGETKMLDRVEFLPPFGMSGKLLLPFLYLQLLFMFNFRHKKMKEIFG